VWLFQPKLGGMGVLLNKRPYGGYQTMHGTWSVICNEVNLNGCLEEITLRVYLFGLELLEKLSGG
jgi:hypothetical protein